MTTYIGVSINVQLKYAMLASHGPGALLAHSVNLQTVKPADVRAVVKTIEILYTSLYLCI